MPQLIFSILNNSIKLLYGSSISVDEPYNNLIELLYGKYADIDKQYNNLIELFKIENIKDQSTYSIFIWMISKLYFNK